jgi:hypothetical protein
MICTKTGKELNFNWFMNHSKNIVKNYFTFFFDKFTCTYFKYLLTSLNLQEKDLNNVIDMAIKKSKNIDSRRAERVLDWNSCSTTISITNQ